VGSGGFASFWSVPPSEGFENVSHAAPDAWHRNALFPLPRDSGWSQPIGWFVSLQAIAPTLSQVFPAESCPKVIQRKALIADARMRSLLQGHRGAVENRASAPRYRAMALLAASDCGCTWSSFVDRMLRNTLDGLAFSFEGALIRRIIDFVKEQSCRSARCNSLRWQNISNVVPAPSSESR